MYLKSGKINKLKMKNHSRKSSWKIFGIILLSVGTFSLMILLQTVIMPMILNTKIPFIIMTTPSMEPTYNVGDLIIVTGVDPVDIRNGSKQDKNGDVIVFSAFGLWEGAPDIPVIHRVIGKWFDRYRHMWFFNTSGDANIPQDPKPIPEIHIYGVVWGSIPMIGWVKIILEDLNIFIPLIIGLSILILIEIIWNLKRKNGFNISPIIILTSLIFYLFTFLNQVY